MHPYDGGVNKPPHAATRSGSDYPLHHDILDETPEESYSFWKAVDARQRYRDRMRGEAHEGRGTTASSDGARSDSEASQPIAGDDTAGEPDP
jgi:hypothetical protein